METRAVFGENATERGIDRRNSLLQAAYDVISQVGFEGLRTRVVAARAGVNIATLHYYFPTKRALIEALAEFLGKMFMTVHGPAPTPSGRASLDRLRQEFSDAAFYMTERRDLVRVIRELTVRAERDEVARNVLSQMDFYWRRSIESMIQDGIKEGTFRPEVDPNQAASMFVAIISGLGAVGTNGLYDVQRGVEAWLVLPPKTEEKNLGE